MNTLGELLNAVNHLVGACLSIKTFEVCVRSLVFIFCLMYNYINRGMRLRTHT